MTEIVSLVVELRMLIKYVPATKELKSIISVFEIVSRLYRVIPSDVEILIV
jgi:hypothetical protein